MFQFYLKTSGQLYAERKISRIGSRPWLFIWSSLWYPLTSSCPGFKKEKSHCSSPLPVWRPCCVFILIAAHTLVSERRALSQSHGARKNLVLQMWKQKPRNLQQLVTTGSPQCFLPPRSAGHFSVLFVFLPCELLALPSPQKKNQIHHNPL